MHRAEIPPHRVSISIKVKRWILRGKTGMLLQINFFFLTIVTTVLHPPHIPRSQLFLRLLLLSKVLPLKNRNQNDSHFELQFILPYIDII